MVLAVTASAAEQNQKKATGGGKSGKAAVASSAHVRGSANMQRSRQVAFRPNSSTHVVSRGATASKRSNTSMARSNVKASSNLKAASNARTHRATSRSANNHTVTKNLAAKERVTRSQDVQGRRSVAGNTNRNVTVNRTRNVNRNVTVVNHWSGNRFAGRNYTAFRNYHRAWHDRGWWRSHYNHIIFVSGGWYFWNAGYWYPAWGYDSDYSYPYDGPIYGAATLAPNQIVVSVQQQLQADGYYSGPIDGVLGSQTRYALAAYQADHGLAVTSAVDEPTLATLGLA
jgi:hypothetical protein